MNEEFEEKLTKGVSDLVLKYPGIALEKIAEGSWQLLIPESYKVGHEAHFGQVTRKFLGYLSTGTIPEWEIPDMIVKYYTTTEGMKKAMEQP